MTFFDSSYYAFVYESFNKLNPDCFHDFFLLNLNVHEYFTRQSNSDDAFRANWYLGAKAWNEFPEMLKALPKDFHLNIILNNTFKTLYTSELSRTR